MKSKLGVYVACAVAVLVGGAYFVCGLIAFTPLGSLYGHPWQYGGSMGVGRFSPFPDETAIAYSSSRSGTSHIYTVNWSGKTTRQLTHDTRGDSDVCVSPDGKAMVFARQEAGSVHLWRMDANGTDQRQLTFGPGSQTEPFYSQDGKRIAYVESVPTTGGYAVAVMNADGTGRTPLTDGSKGQDTTPVFDPTGAVIYFSRYQDNIGRMEVWAITLADRREHKIGFGNHPAVNVRGTQIVFLDAPQNQTLGMMNTNGTGRVVLEHSTDYGSCLRYSNDGLQLLLLTGDADKSEIWEMPVGGTGRYKIATIK